MGTISISMFLICLLWLHSCLLAGVPPLGTIVCALLFSWLPSPRKIRRRRRQFRGYSNQLARLQTLSLLDVMGSQPDLSGTDFSRFGCLTLMTLVLFAVFLRLSCPGCWNLAVSSLVRPCPSEAQALLLPSPVLMPSGTSMTLRLSRLLLLFSGIFVLQTIRSCFLIGLGSHEWQHKGFQHELDLLGASRSGTRPMGGMPKFRGSLFVGGSSLLPSQ